MSNRWWEIIVLCDPTLEESIFWRLEQFGCSGTATEAKEERWLIRAYIPEVKVQKSDLAELERHLDRDAMLVEATVPEVKWQLIDEEDWANSWKQHWQPTNIGDRFTIYPAWLETPSTSDRLIMRLDPGVAFGTGTHPTTQLCLESLEMRFYDPTDSNIIADIGCGSGILSIAASLLQAKQVYAVDTDPLATKTTRSNCQLNHIDSQQVKVIDGSIERLLELDISFDGIVCNILADTITELFPQFDLISGDRSWAILSGILLEQADDIASLVEYYGWTVAALWRRKEWCCFNIRRSEY
ncbi:50S ribosomal protein L11 methyltransferase [Myxosarcina sp. GI1]|uniref:50S ribosomal protein L11 methyltransferase n=1 Tax=Myxosarcina sp. GI1 TaxID=1541065 RepID=UPI00056ACAA1|nr:50S ribosomal protein L11 methyltransferase [Myxosarcina sp. GI1]